jgi:hypothetical protein
MVRLTTVALIERKPSISRDLFTRYWRDVHGVMAARIPGFESYTQHHVTPVSENAFPFEGVAIVRFANEEDAAGLMTSEVTAHIHRDEQNVFRSALLYSLGEGADRVVREAARAADEPEYFHIVPDGADPIATEQHLLALEPKYLAAYDLTTGDPAGWNNTDVEEGGARPLFVAAFHTRWRSPPETAGLPVATYRLDAVYAMVEAGRPTTVGLRGLDAALTIEEIGAANQVSDDVVRAVYGAWAAP